MTEAQLPLNTRRSHCDRRQQPGGYATPVAAQPYFGRDRSNVYTVVDCKVDKELTRQPQGSEGDQFSVMYPAGTIPIRNGFVIRQDFPSVEIPIEFDQKYMLFLTYNHKTVSYSILSAWDVTNPTPVHVGYD